jgi:hypothetical protein
MRAFFITFPLLLSTPTLRIPPRFQRNEQGGGDVANEECKVSLIGVCGVGRPGRAAAAF